MNTIGSLAEALRRGRIIDTDVELGRKAGMSRQSVAKALSGDHNFTVTSLLALAEANGLEVVLVPREAARALRGTGQPHAQGVATMASDLQAL